MHIDPYVSAAWPVRPILSTDPLRIALWLRALAGVPLEDDLVRASFRVLDHLPTSKRE